MSAMSDYLENKLADYIMRGQAYSPAATVYFALFTAAPSDSGGGTECSGGSYARASVACSLANFSGTQSAGSTTASSGTGGRTSNNGAITFPSPSGAWGTATHWGVFDASTSGNLLFHGSLTNPVVIGATDPAPSFAANAFGLTFSCGSDYLENNLVDFVLRGQSFTAPTTLYVALLTATAADTGGGTEASGGSYARTGLACSLANWSGTQSVGSTTASSGTGGRSSNNNAITYPSPTATWGAITHWKLMDASSGGNQICRGTLAATRNVNNGDAAPSFAADSFALTFA